MEFLIIAALLGVIPAVIAAKKGRNFFGWWLFGAALFIVALPVAILISPNPQTRKKCPACALWIAKEATKCQYCGTELSSVFEPGYINPRDASRRGDRPQQGRRDAGRGKEAIDSWNAAAASELATKECPQCAESVRVNAKVCRFCGYEFTAPAPKYIPY
jgi:RNA polymerase subunit RPABC4/transcription elongation factor Spt4